MTHVFADPESVMRRALALAGRGLGAVEPNPPVGAVLVDEGLRLIGEGYHDRFGGPHAEVRALAQAGDRAAGAILFVTLEPCCHQGKTGPCTQAIIEAGVRQVVVAMQDPAPHASGRGIAELQNAGIRVEVGLLANEVADLLAPYCKLVTSGLPWVHAKWAMTLDGKIASNTGESRWISNEASRAIAHRLRGRMDAIIIGKATALIDDPLLTARPPGPRTATRIVVDCRASLPLDSQLVRTVDQAPVLVAAAESAPAENVARLESAGVEVLRIRSSVSGVQSQTLNPQLSTLNLLQELGRRQMTNVLVEGGGTLLGSFFDRRLIDEVHVFVAPKLLGGADAVTPIAGQGLTDLSQLPQLEHPEIEFLDGDVYIHGRLQEHPHTGPKEPLPTDSETPP